MEITSKKKSKVKRCWDSRRNGMRINWLRKYFSYLYFELLLLNDCLCLHVYTSQHNNSKKEEMKINARNHQRHQFKKAKKNYFHLSVLYLYLLSTQDFVWLLGSFFLHHRFIIEEFKRLIFHTYDRPSFCEKLS